MNSEFCIKVIVKVFSNYARKAFIDNESIDKLIDDFLSILALKVDMCLIDLDEDDSDDSQTEEFTTMTKTLKKVLKLISEEKQNKIENKELIESTEYLIEYLTKESTKSKYIKEILDNDYCYDIRENFVKVAYDYFINNEQGQKLFRAYKLINENLSEAENILSDFRNYLN
ncbi:hypothetical protein M9Y10_014463 [Tritrichomonas musculus]|uniref:Uncharacterized protein n=1 Tax=Tritrichomonas musculus TaxID=1915356 RepID=A0ABR2L2T8_9EUKA